MRSGPVESKDPSADASLARFFDCLHASVDAGTFVKLTLGHPSGAASPLRKLLFRPVEIRGERRCCVVSRFLTRDETKNPSFAEAIGLVRERLGSEFLSAHLVTETEELQLEADTRRGRSRLRTLSRTHAPAGLGHDRARSRWVDAAAPYLRALEVTDAQGRVRERMGDKFRQIERFVDLLASAYRESALPGSGRPLTYCDMGSGKGYLTFAAYDYFRRVEQRAVSGTGVETRPDMVRLCNRVAAESGFDGLRFVQSPIADFPLPADLDVLIALHACNTATDDALFAGIRAGAQILLAAPCCHKEARPQVDRAHSGGTLADILRHGIFAERHAEMATDALRALLLEREGYRVRVTEFVAAEHTAKNVMLIATRRPALLPPDAVAELDQRIAGLKRFYGIEHLCLEQLLLGRRQLERPAAAAGPVPPV